MKKPARKALYVTEIILSLIQTIIGLFSGGRRMSKKEKENDGKREV